MSSYKQKSQLSTIRALQQPQKQQNSWQNTAGRIPITSTSAITATTSQKNGVLSQQHQVRGLDRVRWANNKGPVFPSAAAPVISSKLQSGGNFNSGFSHVSEYSSESISSPQLSDFNPWEAQTGSQLQPSQKQQLTIPSLLPPPSQSNARMRNNGNQSRSISGIDGQSQNAHSDSAKNHDSSVFGFPQLVSPS